MKVKELIKELEKHNPEDDVYAWNCGCGGCGMYEYDIEKVERRIDFYDNEDGVILNM